MLTRLGNLWRHYEGTLYSAPAECTVPGPPEGFVFGPVDATRFDKDPVFAMKDRARRFHERFTSPHTCMGLADQDGQTVSYIWLSLAVDNPLDVPFRFGLKLRLNLGQAYIWDCATHPPYQGRGFYPHCLLQARDFASRRGAGRAYIGTDLDNVASIKGILRAGFTEHVRYEVTRRGPIRAVYVNSGRTQLFWKSGASCLLLNP